jgi:hypothetical protein
MCYTRHFLCSEFLISSSPGPFACWAWVSILFSSSLLDAGGQPPLFQRTQAEKTKQDLKTHPEIASGWKEDLGKDQHCKLGFNRNK